MHRVVPSGVDAEVLAKARRALVSLGYCAKDAEGALARVPWESRANLERVVRHALGELA